MAEFWGTWLASLCNPTPITSFFYYVGARDTHYPPTVQQGQ